MCHHHNATSFIDVVRDEIRQFLLPTLMPEPTSAPNYEVKSPQFMAYADLLRRPLIGRQPFQPSTAPKQEWFLHEVARMTKNNPL